MKYALPLLVLAIVVLAMVATPHRTAPVADGTAQLTASSGLLAAELGVAADDSAKASDKEKVEDPAKPKKKEEAKTGTDKGIGPIKELKLGPIDEELAEKGKAIFTKKCTVCHQLDSKKIGPPLRDVVNQQTPEFIMNMILNTDQMEKKDPTVKKLIAQYQTYMSVLDLNKDQARSVLEYLRSAAAEKTEK
jgi:mono/diheme cytochrome c family protein